MADFLITADRWRVRVNDGHEAEEYRIEAPSQAEAKRIAEELWAKRSGAEDAEPPVVEAEFQPAASDKKPRRRKR